MNYPAHIVILDDHPLVAEGLKSVCAGSGWESVVVSFTVERDFWAYLAAAVPDLFLIDLQLRDTDGREVVGRLKQQVPAAKVIVLSAFEDPVVIRSAYAAGADAYIIKNATFEELLSGIRAIWEGQAFTQREVMEALAENPRPTVPRSSIALRLTRREKDILGLIVRERTTKEIAAALFLSEKTIETHRSNLMIKLDVRNIAGLVRKTIEWGILD